jgi:hypothetical protein
MIELSDAEAMNVVSTFRRTNYMVARAWNTLNSTGISTLAGGGRWAWGPFTFQKGEIVGPNGLKLFYDDLRYELDPESGRAQWTFSYAGTRTNIYGGKLMENLCQFAARIHTLDAAIRIQKRARNELGKMYYLAQQAHDENVFVVRDEHVEGMEVIMKEEMCRQPEWAPGLPLATDPVGVGQSYGDVK